MGSRKAKRATCSTELTGIGKAPRRTNAPDTGWRGADTSKACGTAHGEFSMPSTCNGLSTKRLFREEQNPRRRDATKVDLSETKRALSRWRQTIQELGGTATFILLPGHTRECLRTRNGGCPSSNVHCPIGRSTIVTFLFRHPVRDYVWQRAGAHLPRRFFSEVHPSPPHSDPNARK
jgi:hypothetical protein